MLRTLSVVLALLLALGTPALADPGKGKSKGNAAEATTDDIVEGVVAGVLNAVLTDDERRIIHEYFHDHAGNFGKVKPRSEEHTSELQSLMRISYAAFCLKKKN